MAISNRTITVNDVVIHVVQGSELGKELELMALAESKDGTPAPLSHAATEVWSPNHHGVYNYGVRKDTPAPQSDDGEAHPVLLDATGKVWVQVGNPTLGAGSAKIGEVDIDLMPASTFSDSQVATAQVFDRAVAGADRTVYEVKRAAVDLTATNNAVVSQVTAKRLLVLEYFLWLNADASWHFRDGAGTALNGGAKVAKASQGMIHAGGRYGALLPTATNQALQLTLSAGTGSVLVHYIEIT